MRPRIKPRQLAAAIAEDPAIRVELALALQDKQHAWRQRRTDEFTPIDIRSAQHRTTIQACISAAFVTEALRARGITVAALDGEEVGLYVPLLRMPKRLLMGVKATNANGASLPVVLRYRDAPIIAEGLARRIGAESNDHPLRLILEILGALNPINLSFEIDHWYEGQRKSWWRRRRRRQPTLRLGAARDDTQLRVDRHLTYEGVRAWLRWKLKTLEPDLEDSLVPLLDGLIRQACNQRSALALNVPVIPGERSALQLYSTIDELLLCGIATTFRILDNTPAPTKRALAQAEVALRAAGLTSWTANALKRVAQFKTWIEPGVASLSNLAASSETVVDDLKDELEHWTPLVITRVTLGTEFVLNLDERLPLGPWHPLPGENRRDRLRDWLRLSDQQYPLELLDAPSVHVELRLEEPELRIPLRPMWQKLERPRRIRVLGLHEDRQRIGDELFVDYFKLRLPTKLFFEGEARTSPRALHFYASYPQDGSAFLAEVKNPKLAAPIKLSLQMHLGFMIFALAFTLSALFIGDQAWLALRTHVEPRFLTGAIALSTLTITVSLWLIQYQAPNPLLARKLRFYRLFIGGAALVIVVSVIVLVRQIVFGPLRPRPADPVSAPPARVAPHRRANAHSLRCEALLLPDRRSRAASRYRSVRCSPRSFARIEGEIGPEFANPGPNPRSPSLLFAAPSSLRCSGSCPSRTVTLSTPRCFALNCPPPGLVRFDPLATAGSMCSTACSSQFQPRTPTAVTSTTSFSSRSEGTSLLLPPHGTRPVGGAAANRRWAQAGRIA